MEALAVVLVLAGALIPLVLPLFRPPLLALRAGGGPVARLQALELRKSAIYGAIREVGFDLRTDKVEQSDYDQQIALLKREAVEVVGEIEALKESPPQASREVERAIAAFREGGARGGEEVRHETVTPGRFCTQCGHAADDGDRFCAKCGAGLEPGE